MTFSCIFFLGTQLQITESKILIFLLKHKNLFLSLFFCLLILLDLIV